MNLGGIPSALPSFSVGMNESKHVRISPDARGISIQSIGAGCTVYTENRNPSARIDEGDFMGLPFTNCLLYIQGDGVMAEIFVTEFLEPESRHVHNHN